MALTALIGSEAAKPFSKYPVKEKESEKKPESARARREDSAELRNAVLQENRSAQKSARVGAEQLLGKIDFSA